MPTVILARRLVGHEGTFVYFQIGRSLVFAQFMFSIFERSFDFLDADFAAVFILQVYNQLFPAFLLKFC